MTYRFAFAAFWAEDERSGRAEARRQAERERHQRINHKLYV